MKKKDRDALIVQAKTLKRVMGMSYSEIGRRLGISVSTVGRYLRISSEDIRELEGIAKQIYLEQEVKLSSASYQKMMDRLNDPEKEKKVRFFELAGAYKIARDAGTPKGGASQQVNIAVINDKENRIFRIEQKDT